MKEDHEPGIVFKSQCCAAGVLRAVIRRLNMKRLQTTITVDEDGLQLHSDNFPTLRSFSVAAS